MRYIVGSRMFMLGEAMSILARSTQLAVGELAGTHPSEQVKILLDRTCHGTGCRVPAPSGCHGDSRICVGGEADRRMPCPSSD